MNKRLWGIAFAAMIVIGVLYGCKKGDSPDTGGGGGDDPNKDFKIGMLTNLADNIIVPAYTDLQNKLGLLETSINAFMATPSVSTQADLKISFKNAYLSFEEVSVDNFGPASSLLLNDYSNTFPSDTSRVQTGITSGTYNLNQPITSNNIQGLPALDYLLFSPDAIAKFADAGAANRKQYVTDVIAKMKALVSGTLAQWNGSYRTVFINSTKTDVGSSIGFIINQFAFEMDALKGPRIGWPYGKQSGGVQYVDKCEGYYAGFSTALAIANLTSLKNHYKGGTGDGIDNYLVLLNKTQLNTDVLAQFDIALAALQAVPDPMSVAFVNNHTEIDEAYKQVQKLLTLLKTDVASATAVRINYQDSDGD